jgi:hypothetical protein
MPEWTVRVTGNERDLRFLATTLRNADCRVVEEDGEFRLRSSRFETLVEIGEVKAAADEMIKMADLVASVWCDGYRRVFIDRIMRLAQDGSRQGAEFRRLKVSFTVVPSTSLTNVGSVEEPRDLNQDISLLKRRPLLLKAIRYVDGEPGWPGYWKAVEALGEQVGGVDQIAKLGWATEDEVARFRKTAHHHRHHRSPAPADPMTQDAGRSFVRRLLQRCVDRELTRGQSAR